MKVGPSAPISEPAAEVRQEAPSLAELVRQIKYEHQAGQDAEKENLKYRTKAHRKEEERNNHFRNEGRMLKQLRELYEQGKERGEIGEAWGEWVTKQTDIDERTVRRRIAFFDERADTVSGSAHAKDKERKGRAAKKSAPLTSGVVKDWFTRMTKRHHHDKTGTDEAMKVVNDGVETLRELLESEAPPAEGAPLADATDEGTPTPESIAAAVGAFGLDVGQVRALAQAADVLGADPPVGKIAGQFFNLNRKALRELRDALNKMAGRQ